MQEADYTYAGCIEPGLHVLKRVETGKYEIWETNKFYAGYAIFWRNTDLAFVRNADACDLSRAGVTK